MLRSNSFRWLVALIVAGIGIAVVALTGYVPPFSNRPNIGPPPAGPFSNRQSITPPVVTPLTPLREVSPATAADEAKGIFSGPIGEFVITPRKKADYPPCPEPIKRTQNYKGSELYSPIFGDNLEVYECGNGRILSVAIIGGPAMGRRYFIGPAILPWQGPFDRLKLLTVGGHSAIVQLPHPAFPGSMRLAVIQRFPTDNGPGILVWIDDAGSSLEKAAALAARIIGLRL
ncbi:MAG TPA: hypothetical protein VNA31_11720 [bacterium]|nr:hypothetical protein [bacterium]